MDSSRSLKSTIWAFLSNGLWTEALKLFFGYAHSWLIGAVLFAVILAFIDYIAALLPVPFLWSLIQLALHISIIYFFTAAFLYQEPLSASIRPHFKQFIRTWIYLAVIFQTSALIFYPLFFASYLQTLFPLAVVIALQFIGLCLALWILARLLCAGPLAASNIKAPIVKSWGLTKGNTARLIANMFMLFVFVAPYGIFIERMHSALLTNLLIIPALGLYAAFACAASRILNGENIAATLGRDRRAAQRG